MVPSAPVEAVRVLERLVSYCERNDWSGYDPYDALNSRLIARSPLAKSRVCRIGVTQVLKRLPVNVRSLLGISPEANPKALALFLSAYVSLSRRGWSNAAAKIPMLAERLMTLRSDESTDWCWGYSFPWQTRTVMVPRGAANLVCTMFVAEAFMDAYEATGQTRFVDIAESAASYVVNELYWKDGAVAGFSYPRPGLRGSVHNSNFLAAALLLRVSRATNNIELIEPALAAATYSLSRQNHDGSWYYGEAPTQRWIDNFHTGYNLCALRSIARDAGDEKFEDAARRGFEFYRGHLLSADGLPKYFHDRIYPIDVHAVAQSIITLVVFRDRDSNNVDMAKAIVEWAVRHMRDREGYFYYQKLPRYTNRISYMRWSQAWMLAALTALTEVSPAVLPEERTAALV